MASIRINPLTDRRCIASLFAPPCVAAALLLFLLIMSTPPYAPYPSFTHVRRVGMLSILIVLALSLVLRAIYLRKQKPVVLEVTATDLTWNEGRSSFTSTWQDIIGIDGMEGRSRGFSSPLLVVRDLFGIPSDIKMRFRDSKELSIPIVPCFDPLNHPHLKKLAAAGPEGNPVAAALEAERLYRDLCQKQLRISPWRVWLYGAILFLLPLVGVPIIFWADSIDPSGSGGPSASALAGLCFLITAIWTGLFVGINAWAKNKIRKKVKADKENSTHI